MTQDRRVTDGQTDRQTDGRTDGIAAASTALPMRALRRDAKMCFLKIKMCFIFWCFINDVALTRTLTLTLNLILILTHNVTEKEYNIDSI